ncbi:MAG: methylated-DNA--[protein]-cysteine S-methyltransferase [Planctomycetota bacterium]
MKEDLTVYCYCRTPSPLGPLLLTGNDRGLTGLFFRDHLYPPKQDESWKHDTEPFGDVAEQIDEYLEGEREKFELPLSLSGTEFQKSVWQLLLEIPCGQTRTYGSIARQLGKPNGGRAVGAAVGRNPISIIVPCHRVIGASGSLTGYAGGVRRKEFLLELENARATLGDGYGTNCS